MNPNTRSPLARWVEWPILIVLGVLLGSCLVKASILLAGLFVFVVLGGLLILIIFFGSVVVSVDRSIGKAALKRVLTSDTELDTSAWFAWLSRPWVTRFAFYETHPNWNDDEQLCMVYKQGRVRNRHWVAVRQGLKKRWNVDLGASKQVTLAALEKAADQLRKQAVRDEGGTRRQD